MNIIFAFRIPQLFPHELTILQNLIIISKVANLLMKEKQELFQSQNCNERDELIKLNQEEYEQLALRMHRRGFYRVSSAQISKIHILNSLHNHSESIKSWLCAKHRVKPPFELQETL